MQPAPPQILMLMKRLDQWKRRRARLRMAIGILASSLMRLFSCNSTERDGMTLAAEDLFRRILLLVLRIDRSRLINTLYASGNPVDFKDPSGEASFAESAAAGDIASTLRGIQANFGLNLGMAAVNPMTAGGSIIFDCAAILVPGAIGKSASMIGYLFSKGKVFKLGQGRGALAKNLEIYGLSKSGNQQAHHIVPFSENFPGAREAWAILKKWNIDINSPLNGVWMDVAGTVEKHSGRHTKAYSKEIGERIVAADATGSAVQVRSVLAKIRGELKAGEWDQYLYH